MVMAMTLDTPDPGFTNAEIEAILDAMEDASPGKAEYLDGVFTMSRPQVVHQQTLMELYVWLRDRLPPELELLPDIQVMTPGTWIIPDLVVARRSTFDANPLRITPADVVLLIEITSPSTIGRDRNAKRAFCAEHEIDYWIVAPGRPWGEVEVHRFGSSGIDVPPHPDSPLPPTT